MSRAYSLAYLTGNGVDPVTAVGLAADHGYDMVSFRLLPAGPLDNIHPLLEDDRLLAEVKAAMRATGVTMADAEMIRLNPATVLDDFTPFLDRIAELGARHVLVAVDDIDISRVQDNYTALCDKLGGYRLTADLEFMPWTGVKDLATARRIVETANHPAAAVLFDTLHFDRCGSTLEEFAALPTSLMNYVQICDGPAPYDTSDAALVQVARTARLIPGEGGIDLASIAKFIPQDMTVSVEVPNHALADRIGPSEVARRALAATKELLGD
ncbi:sugar phosphate isomerase/epimerase [Hwanghaeella grinnelliae]|uniref:Sugar phosphate isomerase/epimerase n=1 Tax=Hwanghaeella grinnelliae TaxID=2500179 RepID=A0A3S2VR18_9PROT|nr:TIM barrel protein [Hwanghaeella grinnelliae]RVU39600.1 sugar phosphate isomerase/epimerase [Hwanghaeella grinnelliae]